MNIWLSIHVAEEVLLFASPSNVAPVRLSLMYQVHLNAEKWKDRTLSQWQKIFISQGKKKEKKSQNTTLSNTKKVHCAEESVFTVPTWCESFFQRADAHFKVKNPKSESATQQAESQHQQSFFFIYLFFFTWLQLVSPPEMFASGCERGLLAFRKAGWAEKRVLPLQPDRDHLLFLTTPLTFFFFCPRRSGGD